MHLKKGTVEKIIELYGYKRVEHVLANTVQERRGDGRFRPDNRAWAESHYIPEDEMHNYCFAARSHSAILDGFISNYRKLVMDLGMFDQKQCEPDSSELDYTGKVLVLSPNTLKEEYWSPENQLWRRVALGAARLHAGAPFFVSALATANRHAGTGMILLGF